MKVVGMIRKCLDYATRGIVSLGILASAVACQPKSADNYTTVLERALVTADKNSDGVLQVTETSQFLRELGYKGILMENDRFSINVTNRGDVEVRRMSGLTEVDVPRSGLEKYLERNKR